MHKEKIIIKIENLEKKYLVDGTKNILVLNGINLNIHEGEFLILLGPSGCGKSTFLRILAGLDTQTNGKIFHEKGYGNKDISFVFQNFGVLPWLTVEKNISLNLIGKNVSPAKIEKQVSEIISVFGLTAFRHRYPHELSGGMKQRVGLARAFVSNPKIIFLDEPFSELDFFTSKELRDVLTTMWQNYQTTVVMVSHYVDEAVSLGDRIAVFSDRPSKIITIVKNDLERPRNPRSKEFFIVEDEVIDLLKSKNVV